MRITALNGNADPGNQPFDSYLQMNAKLFAALQQAGRDLAEGGRFAPEQLRALAQPERYPIWMAPIFIALAKTDRLNTYWDDQPKENGVYEQRFARPFADE